MTKNLNNLNNIGRYKLCYIINIELFRKSRMKCYFSSCYFKSDVRLRDTLASRWWLSTIHLLMTPLSVAQERNNGDPFRSFFIPRTSPRSLAGLLWNYERGCFETYSERDKQLRCTGDVLIIKNIIIAFLISKLINEITFNFNRQTDFDLNFDSHC